MSALMILNRLSEFFISSRERISNQLTEIFLKVHGLAVILMALSIE